MPLDILAGRDMLEKMMSITKKQTSENMKLVSLDGDCPDVKLWETGQFQSGKKEGFEGRKRIDSKN